MLKGVNEHIEKGGEGRSHRPVRLGQVHTSALPEPARGANGGEIIFEDKNITAKDTDINLVRRRMGMVFQQFNLFRT